MPFHLFKKPDTNASTPAPATDDTEERLCAWCLKEQGIVPTEGSHGICGFHASLMLEAARVRAAQRSNRA